MRAGYSSLLSFLACFRTVVEYSDSDTDLSTDDQSFEIESQVEILRYGYTQRNSVVYCSNSVHSFYSY